MVQGSRAKPIASIHTCPIRQSSLRQPEVILHRSDKQRVGPFRPTRRKVPTTLSAAQEREEKGHREQSRLPPCQCGFPLHCMASLWLLPDLSVHTLLGRYDASTIPAVYKRSWRVLSSPNGAPGRVPHFEGRRPKVCVSVFTPYVRGRHSTTATTPDTPPVRATPRLHSIACHRHVRKRPWHPARAWPLRARPKARRPSPYNSVLSDSSDRT